MIVKLCKINVKNKDNKTPLDLAAEAGKMNVANILREGGAERGNRVVRNVESVAAYLISPSTHRETITRWLCVMIKDLTIEMRSMVLVVAALLITTAYQVALQPPGGGSNGKQPKQNVVINGNRKMGKVTMSVNGHSGQHHHHFHPLYGDRHIPSPTPNLHRPSLCRLALPILRLHRHIVSDTRVRVQLRYSFDGLYLLYLHQYGVDM